MIERKEIESLLLDCFGRVYSGITKAEVTKDDFSIKAYKVGSLIRIDVKPPNPAVDTDIPF